MYDKNTIYIVGHGRTGKNNPITEHYNIFFIGFVVEVETGKIIDLECSCTISITERFVHSLFLEKSLADFNENLEEEIERRYFGSSRRAIIVAYKDAIKKYNEAKNKYY